MSVRTGIAATAVISIVAILVWASPLLAHRGRVLPGVSVGGVDVGRLAPDEAADELARRLRDRPHSTYVTLYDPDGADAEWTFSAFELGLSISASESAQRALAVGRAGGAAARLLDPWRAIRAGRDVPPRWFVANEDTAVLNDVSEAVARPPANARIELVGDQLVARESQLGRGLDRAATLGAVLRSLDDGATAPRVATEFSATAPRIASLADVERAFRLTTSGPITVRSRGDVLATAPVELIESWVTIQDVANEQGDLVPSIVFDRQALYDWVAPLAPATQREPRDARFDYDHVNLRAVVRDPGQLGTTLDIDATIDRVIDAGYTEHRIAEAALHVSAPRILPQDAARLVTAIPAGQAFTRISGQGEARLAHISFAAATLQGIALAPDQEFSLLEALGPITTTTGYLLPLLRPDPAAGPGWVGGLEQVATTYYRAAFWAGLPVSQRHPPPFRSGWLEPPVGLDAAVQAPTVDLRFVNDTSSYLLLENAVDHGRGALRVTILAQPAITATVRLDGPFVSAVTTPAPPLQRIDADIPPGGRIQAGWAREGASARVGRSVYDLAGRLKLSEVIESVYPAARDVILTGP